MRIEFVNPIYLWFLLSVPFLIATHFFTLKYSKSVALKFSNFEAIARVSRDYRVAKPYSGLMINKNLAILFIRLLALILIILALAAPVFLYTGKASGFDFVLAIDASSSMLADDFPPNRLEAAKNAADLFVNKIPEKAGIGLVSFAGTSFVEQKITENKDELMKKISRLTVKKVGGTDLGGALVSASNLLLMSDKSKAIILLTDGRSNVGISIDEAIDYVKENDISVYTIGVGTEEGGSFGVEELISTLDERTLEKIALELGGKYYRAEDEDELNNAYVNIANIEDIELSFELSFIFILTALLLLFLEWILVNTKYRIVG